MRRPALASLALVLVYLALSLVLDPGGYLGTDTGAKVATLEAMDRSGSARPNVGYWAEEWDPRGVVHPLYQSKRVDDGEWVAVTTLPMLEAARPLYALGGYRLTLLLPMLGGLACALGARRLARQVGGEPGWNVFWVVGLGSPIALYSLDLWEHVVGVAAIVWAVSLLVDAAASPTPERAAVGAGALLGLAATMRTEALVYTLVAVGVACVARLVHDRRAWPAVRQGVGAVLGFAAMWGANRALEEAVGGLSRTVRASDTASATAEDAVGQLGDRVQEALVTSFGVKGATTASWLLGAGILVVLALGWRSHRRGDRTMALTCVGLAGLVYLLGAISDLGFVPGMVPAFPVIAGLAIVRPSGAGRTVLWVALSALPVVWAFQYLGGAGPQWGGRYVLPSAVLLGTLALVGLEQHPDVRRALVGLAAGVTALGLVWVAVRTRSVDDLFDDLRAANADVLIVRDAFLLREGGPVVLDEQWLTASGEDQFALATEVAERAGASSVAVVELGAPAPPEASIPEGWEEVARSETDLTGDPIGVVVYRLPA
ncbi:MAG: hypothetical protein ACRDYW_06905 [Acidimicrobiales bacterium]